MHAENATGASMQSSGIISLMWKHITILMQSPFAKSMDAILLPFIVMDSMVFLYPSFSPVTTVEVAVANGFGNGVESDCWGAVEVGDGACHLQYAFVGAC